jgi:hypothetical protein
MICAFFQPQKQRPPKSNNKIREGQGEGEGGRKRDEQLEKEKGRDTD